MSPYFLLSILIGSVYGTIFYIWQGQGVKDIIYYGGASTIGFGLGQVAVSFLGWQWYLIGFLHLVEASISAWAALFLARWLRIS